MSFESSIGPSQPFLNLQLKLKKARNKGNGKQHDFLIWSALVRATICNVI